MINNLLNSVLVFDIETSAHYNGQPINLRTDFELYVEHAIVKWFGAYSYKHNKYYEFNDRQQIIELLAEHNTLVGFNNKTFDYPILLNNGLCVPHKHKNLDVMLILGVDKYRKEFKQRSIYMGVTLSPVFNNNKTYGANSLMGMAHAFNLPIIKTEIDYNIFFKTQWSDTETQDIIKYLHNDVEMTKLLFDKLINFWSLFTHWLEPHDVSNWLWIDSTIANLTYHAACKVRGIKPKIENVEKVHEEMGGRAVVPPYDEVYGAHYVDEVSKYPHLFSEFNLFNEVDVSKISKDKLDEYIKSGKIFHGNDKFKVRGYYNVTQHGTLEKDIVNKLKTRFEIKRVLKEYKNTGNRAIKFSELLRESLPAHCTSLTDETLEILKGLEYAIKIFANALFGVVYSSMFVSLATDNAGYDCCWLGQQIHQCVHEHFERLGMEVIGGFTDSWFVMDKLKGEPVNKDFILVECKKVMDELKTYMPFPQDTHQIAYECYIDYITYDAGKKNNYAFISDGRVKIVGFPIKKSNATRISKLIFDKYLYELGVKQNRLKFDKKYIESLIRLELERDVSLAAVEFRCNKAISYKKKSQLQSQISLAYLDGFAGNIRLIKNKRIGKVGIGEKYCLIADASRLRYDDLVLDKTWNELSPFILKTKINKLSEWF